MSDLEKTLHVGEKNSVNSYDHEEPTSSDAEVQTTKLNFIDRFAHKLNAETKGIELVTDEEKNDPSLWNLATMWLSANLVIATFSLGALGITVFGLAFGQAVLVIIFFSIIGAFPVAFFSCFGSALGLRQLLLSRFLLGDIATRIFAAINVVACVGWGAVNIMSSAQLLHIVNNGALPPWAGCLILVVCTILVTFFGYHFIHAYERWSWIPNLIIFIIIIVRFAMSGKFHSDGFVGGETTAGNVLSFGGTVYGFATGWSTYAADYTVYNPRTTNKYKIFFSVFAGLLTPLIFTLILGAACATGIAGDERWTELYTEDSVGGLVYAILVEKSLHGFGQFCCVVLALSTVANNVPNMYSVALSAQTVWSQFAKVPRVFWTIFANFATLAICIPAYYKFESVMENFMNLISYYLAIYESIMFSSHFIWHRGKFSAYPYERWNDKSAYPLGLAGTFGFACGVAGVVLGMNQTWYSGVIARQIGEYGGDIGFELGIGFAFVGFNTARYFEKKYIR
ncbi:FCY21 Purine-cytosine permease FCY21 [Candida maltosa Xu316]|uniref:Purine-cytosine permease, putative n=1 Tax=Candida maltosa (strain Xu316) TaxID=1245528 RepID=M3HPD1_CANMX|nr:Purine-cytosine permease, putative [Candida maltosa Xu316]